MIQLQNSNWFKKKNKKILKSNLNQIKSCCINYNQYIQNKIKNKLHTKPINYARFKLEEKFNRTFKKNKRNINVIGDKFENFWSHDIIPKKNIFNRKVEFNLE